jgi:hypothetical protein
MAFVINKNTNYPNGVDNLATGTISVYDSGNIVSIKAPGTAATKVTSGVQNYATTNSCDSTLAGNGNSYQSKPSTPDQESTYGGRESGYSILHE